MAITRNVPKVERIVRTVLGVALIPLGFTVTGLWMPLSIVVGVSLMVTAFVGY